MKIINLINPIDLKRDLYPLFFIFAFNLSLFFMFFHFSISLVFFAIFLVGALLLCFSVFNKYVYSESEVDEMANLMEHDYFFELKTYIASCLQNNKEITRWNLSKVYNRNKDKILAHLYQKEENQATLLSTTFDLLRLKRKNKIIKKLKSG